MTSAATPAPDILVAGPAYAPVLAALHAAAFAGAEAWSAEAIAGLLATPGVFALLHGQGGMLLARLAADEAEILTLAVPPPQRRRGRATALLTAAAAHAAACGAAALFLEVSETNAAARALYGLLGYRLVGRRRRYYPDGSDAFLLRLSLARAAATDR